MNLSKNFSANALVTLTNINLAFDLQKTNSLTLKDSFINFCKSPIQNLFSTNNMYHCLKNISFSIQEGDKIGIIGKNGAGKTSLCHIIAGNYLPISGKIDRHCKIRSVFNANPQIFPELSGKENAQLVSRLLYPELSQKSLYKIVEESITFSELEDFKDVAIKNYSKGMSTRLFLSLITALPTDLLILDEVFDGADEFFKIKFQSRLQNIIEASKATIFINHDSYMLKRYINRAIVIDQGEIVFDGNPLKGFFLYQSKNTKPQETP